MKQSHKATLKRLANGSRTELELTTGDFAETAGTLHLLRYLDECQSLGYCVKIGDTWSLTNSGREAIKVEKAAKIDRICGLSMTEHYKGEDLRQLADRVGAYQFLSCPSLINGNRVYRKDAV